MNRKWTHEGHNIHPIGHPYIYVHTYELAERICTAVNNYEEMKRLLRDWVASGQRHDGPYAETALLLANIDQEETS